MSTIDTPRLEFIGDVIEYDHLIRAAQAMNNGDGESGQVKVIIDRERAVEDETTPRVEKKYMYVEIPEEKHSQFYTELEIAKNAVIKMRSDKKATK